jgi:hypothetical protein
MCLVVEGKNGIRASPLPLPPPYFKYDVRRKRFLCRLGGVGADFRMGAAVSQLRPIPKLKFSKF